MITDDLRAHRETLGREHFADEVAHDWDSVLKTFPHPRYEMIALRHTDDAIVVEISLLGTHLGPLGHVPPTGSAFKVRMTAYFVRGRRVGPQVAERGC